MRHVKTALLAATALVTASAAHAGMVPLCVAGQSADYTALNAGGGCAVGPLTFFNFNPTSYGNATPDTPEITPFQQGGEYGLTLNFGVVDPTKASDVSWQFDVTGPGINDAFVQVLGQTGSTGLITLSETLSDAVTLNVVQQIDLSGQGNFQQTYNFNTTGALFVAKDLSNFPIGTLAASSQLTDAFSVPAPLAGAGLPGLIAGAMGLVGLARRRRKQAA